MIFLGAVLIVGLSSVRHAAESRPLKIARSRAGARTERPMVEIASSRGFGRRRPGRTVARPLGLPRRLEPDHQHRGRAGEGSWLITSGGSAISTTAPGIGVTNTGHADLADRRGDRGRGHEADPRRTAEHRLPRARAASPRAAPARAAGDGWQAFLSNAGPRRSRPRSAGPDRDRPAGGHRLSRRLSRPDGPDDGADHGQGCLPVQATSSLSRLRSTTCLPVLLPGDRRQPRSGLIARATGRPSST